MYRLREMDVNDKVCEQVSMTMLSQVYPKDVIERCVQQSEPWCSKARRVRAVVQQSAAGASQHGLGFGAVCDGDGLVEPFEPMPGVAKAGGQAQRPASGRADGDDE